MPTLGTPGSGQATGASTLTVTGITTTGSNKALFAGVGTSGSTPQLTSSVTYNSVGMTEDWDFTAQSFFHNSGHHMVAPGASGNLVATVAGTQDELTLFGVPLSDVDQSTPIGTVPSNANGASTTASVTVTSATGEIVLAMLYCWWSGATPGSGETEQAEQIVGSSPTGAVYSEAGAASVTIAPTQTAAGGGTSWLINGVSFKAATKTLAAGAGSFTFTGTAATLRIARRLTAAAGAYTFTGTAATLVHAYKVSAGAGSYTFTGTAATLRRTYILTAAAGSFAFTGSTAGLLVARKLAAGAGSFVLTGSDATLTKTGTKSLIADAGSFVLSGSAASLVYVPIAAPASPPAPPIDSGGAGVVSGVKRQGLHGQYTGPAFAPRPMGELYRQLVPAAEPQPVNDGRARELAEAQAAAQSAAALAERNTAIVAGLGRAVEQASALLTAEILAERERDDLQRQNDEALIVALLLAD